MDNIKGLVFHIIHGSFVDGYGVRTTVFLKGCPLRCVWCCNPESQHNYPELKVNQSLCNLCERCVEVCPVNAIKLKIGEGNVEVDRKACTNCGKCVEVCCIKALDIFGRYMTVEEVFDIVRRDKDFYEESGGGVTVGGGEPTFQPHFTYALLKKCKQDHIHTALDTNGYTQTDEAFKVLQEADLRLYDIKGMNPQEHLRNTGASNEVVLANLQKLDGLRRPVIIRMPIVPGCNDSDVNIKFAAEFLSKLKCVERVDLLPYHEYGKVKYKQLGREYRLNAQPPSEDKIKEIKSLLERHGLNVQIGG
jgi:pyruvate formate lyase activating enzyme